MTQLPWYIEEKLLNMRQIDGECWNFTGATIGGYGVLSIQRRPHYTHRIAWMLWKGEIPAGAHLHHVCENRRCFNPEHLELTTASDHQRIHRLGKKRKEAE